MKKILLIGALGLCVLGLTGCNFTAKHFGGTINIELPKNQKLVEATWKDDSLWYLTKPMRVGDVVETYTFQEDSNFGALEGKVIFKESMREGELKGK